MLFRSCSELEGYTFRINADNTVKVNSSIPLGVLSDALKQQFTTGKFIVADTGDGTTEIRKIAKFEVTRSTGGATITLDEAFTLPVDTVYPIKLIDALKKIVVNQVTFYSNSEYPLFINGVPIPISEKATFEFYSEKYPFALFSSGDYFVTEAAVTNVGCGSSSVDSASKIYYFDCSDPAIQGSTAKKKIFTILAGKSTSDFAIALLGSFLIQRCNDNTAADEVVSILANGEVTFKNNQPPKGVYLIIVNL